MKRVIIVGAGKGGSALLDLLSEIEQIELVAITDVDPQAEGLQKAAEIGVSFSDDWQTWLDPSVDIIFEATGSDEVFKELKTHTPEDTVVVPGTIAYVISTLLEEKDTLLAEKTEQAHNQDLILNSIHDGMIVINADNLVTFINQSGEEILHTTKDQVINRPVKEVIPLSRLPELLLTKEKEINRELTLANGKKILTTRIPMVNTDGKTIGAYAIFKDITEAVALAEELTDIKEITTMLEAIIHSSEEAISVVDENGIGLMINPAYTKITGLTEREVIGKPATADISEGESMHMQVLRTKKPVRGVQMKVGPKRRDVLVNVAPVIVDGVLKGSVGVLHDVSELYQLNEELTKAKQLIRNLESSYTFTDLIGNSEALQLVLDQAKIAANTSVTVLLRGESGTGKELLAHAIHHESERRHQKFIRLNCATMSHEHMEEELFGVIGEEDKKGYFEEAHQGTLFLDEIGELPIDVQAKLLRVLQEKEVRRVGSYEPEKIDVRVIAATNMNLEKAIANEFFREDLYYRLNKLPIQIPPLRERKEDLRELVPFLLGRLNDAYGRKVEGIEETAFHRLEDYDWPGNVRELENILGRAFINMENTSSLIRDHHLPPLSNSISPDWNGDIEWSGFQLQDTLDQYEKQLLVQAFRAHNFNKTRTAKALGVSIRNLYYKLDKYGLSKNENQK
ncbi:sigma 54-interacting transcriptional regulator [Salimicrobium halophilum]|uniref:PAS domain S-box-containing protein n=1 Tax=Salimicrobium halophilum TaxID=86666 RepID=A0A1G8PVE0_9BACI|nr:sigma 54-interacting transcriptional regulator [Salimicrobium halophilum]SDI96519.1 PAS domain S-box-containing protein [Salimicrobium halophilum]